MTTAPARAGGVVYQHASCICLGEAGVLVRGSSGSGKSTLCGLLVAQAQARGRFARWVGDDRIGLAVHNGRILARPHPAIAGQAEWRGLGLVSVAHEAAVRVALVVDLADQQGPRLPGPDDRLTVLLGIALPALTVAATAPFEAVAWQIHRTLESRNGV